MERLNKEIWDNTFIYRIIQERKTDAWKKLPNGHVAEEPGAENPQVQLVSLNEELVRKIHELSTAQVRQLVAKRAEA